LPHAPAAQWIERLTSNCVLGVSILYLGENYVYPVDGVVKKLSIKSIISILSTPIVPALPQKPTKSTGLAARLIVQICPAKKSYLLEPTHLFWWVGFCFPFIPQDYLIYFMLKYSCCWICIKT